MVSVLLIVAAAMPALLLFLLWKYSYWYRQGVPQGNPFKLFGDLNDITITSTPHFDNYVALSRKFSGKPFYGIYSISRPRLVVRDPEMVKKEVLTKMTENGFELDKNMEPIMGRDPFFQTGEGWKESRNHFTSVMTPSRLRSMSLQMCEVCKEAVKYLRDFKHESGKGDGVDVKDFAVRFLTNLLIRATVSVDAECFKEEKNVFMEAGGKVFDDSAFNFFAQFIFVLAPKLGPYLGMQIVPKSTVTFFDKVVKSQKEYRSKNGISREDLLDVLMKRAKSDTNAKPSKDDPDLDIVAMVILFFLEGYETTSTGTAGALVELARNSELQDKLRREVVAACPPGKEITEEALNKVPLLQWCFLESLRMYPPGLTMQRVVNNDTTLEAPTGEKVSVKKGSYLNILLGGYHRDPEFFPDPDNYNPERFDDESQSRNFIGFGHGPRQCPGQKFAGLAGRTLIATLLKEFRLELSPKTSYPLKSADNPMIFHLHDVWVRFVPL